MPSSARQEAHLLPCRIWVREGRERGVFCAIRLRTLRSTARPRVGLRVRPGIGEVGLSVAPVHTPREDARGRSLVGSHPESRT